VYDADGLREAMVAARPEVVVHALTAIPQRLPARRIERAFTENDRVRREGTPNLVAAAQAAGARRMVAESIAFAYAPPVAPAHRHVESDPLALDTTGPWLRSVEALDTLESAVLQADGLQGLVLRFGYFYGPGTSYATDGAIVGMVRQRRFPIVGSGEAVWSFVHIDDAAEATLLAVESSLTGVCNVVDDEPAPMADWLPALADSLGARAPRRVPVFLVRMISGDYAVGQMTRGAGADATRAHDELGWQPRHPSWREGFREVLAPA
jgi:nucleoside-diphosphate-sugar epimerase